MNNLYKTKRRIPDAVLDDDKTALIGLQSIVGYKPTNANYTVEKIVALATDWENKQKAAIAAKQAAETAMDDLVDAARLFHDAILGAKNQVVAQFGDDSNEIQTVGMKKRSDYKRPIRKNNKKTTA